MTALAVAMCHINILLHVKSCVRAMLAAVYKKREKGGERPFQMQNRPSTISSFLTFGIFSETQTEGGSAISYIRILSSR